VNFKSEDNIINRTRCFVQVFNADQEDMKSLLHYCIV